MTWESSVYAQRYEKAQLIGSGGLGRAYKAHDINLGRDVVIKELEGQRREEAEVLLSINNDRIPEIYDLFFTEDYTYIVMEYVEGENLPDYLLRNDVEYEERIDIINQIAEILKYLHTMDNPYIYGDLKPDNIIVGGGKVRIVDMGSSVKVGESFDSLYSTDYYLAPEQREGNIFFQSDIYAFGKLMIYILTRVQFEKEGDFTLKDLKNLDIRFRDKIIITNCLKKDYTKRYISGVSLCKALKFSFFDLERCLRMVYIILISCGSVLCGLDLLMAIVTGNEYFITKDNIFIVGIILFLSAILMDINYNTDCDERHIFYELDVKLYS